MLFGRFFLIIPTLAIAGSLVRKRRGAARRRARSRPTRRCSSCLVIGVIVDRRRPHVPPRPRARPHRRAAQASDESRRLHPMAGEKPSCVEPRDRAAGDRRQLRQAQPAHADAEPGDVRRRGRLACSRRSCSSRTSARRRTNENVFAGLVALFLWFTVLFANFAEAIAEGRGKAQADTLRKTRSETVAHRRVPDGIARGGARAPRSTSATRSW